MQSSDETDPEQTIQAWAYGYAAIAIFTLIVSILVRSPAPLAFLAGILLLGERLRRAATYDRGGRKPAATGETGHKVRVPSSRPR